MTRWWSLSTNMAWIVSCNPVLELDDPELQARNHDIMGIFPLPLGRGLACVWVQSKD